MKWISTTIKQRYMIKILNKRKKVEFKEATDFWEKRLHKYIGQHKPGDLGINFLCGRESFKFWVLSVECYSRSKLDDAKPIYIMDKPVWDWYEITLGDEIEEDTKQTTLIEAQKGGIRRG